MKRGLLFSIGQTKAFRLWGCVTLVLCYVQSPATPLGIKVPRNSYCTVRLLHLSQIPASRSKQKVSRINGLIHPSHEFHFTCGVEMAGREENFPEIMYSFPQKSYRSCTVICFVSQARKHEENLYCPHWESQAYVFLCNCLCKKKRIEILSHWLVFPWAIFVPSWNVREFGVLVSETAGVSQLQLNSLPRGGTVELRALPGLRLQGGWPLNWSSVLGAQAVPRYPEQAAPHINKNHQQLAQQKALNHWPTYTSSLSK